MVEYMITGGISYTTGTDQMFKLVQQVYTKGLSTYYEDEEDLQPASSTEKRNIISMLRLTFPSVNIKEVKKVRNNFLTGMYNLKKEEYHSRGHIAEHTMFHSTEECNVHSIILDNLNWRFVKRGKFGIGVSFSSDADYANCHSNRNNGPNRAFIIAKVLVGISCQGYRDMPTPPNMFDTSRDKNNKVVVKYNDNEFLPEYVAYYTCNDIGTSKYYRGPRRNISFSDWDGIFDDFNF